MEANVKKQIQDLANDLEPTLKRLSILRKETYELKKASDDKQRALIFLMKENKLKSIPKNNIELSYNYGNPYLSYNNVFDEGEENEN